MSFDMFPDSAIQYLVDHQDCPLDHKECVMAQHEPPHIKKGEDQGVLGPHCGHHCGVLTTGLTDQQTKHCGCPECHDTDKADVPSNVMPGNGPMSGGLNLGSIT